MSKHESQGRCGLHPCRPFSATKHATVNVPFRCTFKLGNRRRDSVSLRGFDLAEEYHDHDFEWQDLYDKLQPTIEAMNLEGPSNDKMADSWYNAKAWEKFHTQHSSGRFFKERRYLLREFPTLAKANSPQHIVEIGCGCGSSILPILKSNVKCRATVCDVSTSAINRLCAAAEAEGISQHRLHSIVFDAATDPDASQHPLRGLDADAVLLIFTMSALPPHLFDNIISHAKGAMHEKGTILFRDYGLCDMTQLRFPQSQRLHDNLYQRSDGTLSYYFTVEGLRATMLANGLAAKECSYVCVIVKNKKTGKEMKRVFVHGVFEML